MAVIRALQFLFDVALVWKGERLLGDGPDVEEVAHRCGGRVTRWRKDVRRCGSVGRAAAAHHRGSGGDREQTKDEASHGSLSPAWSDAAQVVDDVPHLLRSHLAVVALH